MSGTASYASSESDEADAEEESHWKRFDDFTTIDWAKDAANDRARRKEEDTATTFDSKSSLQRWTLTIVHASQSWFVVALAGAAIGINAALISVITAWLSDFKDGRCAEGWWLNQKFCCWEIEPGGIVGAGMSEEGCEDWVPWSTWSGISYIVYFLYAIVFSGAAAYLVRSFAPYAAGSGISEVKCLLSGFAIPNYLSLPTLAVKSLALPLAIASGLSVGKEGPSVHVACCIGNTVARLFGRFSNSQARMREIITASSAAGVAVAFGSPIGGVLFALEEMTVTFPVKTMWRSFFCALVATVTLAAMNPFRTGKLVLFQVSYDRDWHFFEIGFFVLIGIFGGLYGAFVIKYNFQVQSFRRKHLAAYGMQEAVILAGLTALVGYFNKFLRIDMTESLDILFRECEKGGDYDDLCQTWAQWRMINSLLLATVLRVCLVVISYGCKVPAGIFVPSMAIGATFGRMIGILVKAVYRAYPHAAIFAACDPEKPCITPGTYAFLGAAAALAGIMRITVTVVVIMFELTGALTYILPTMIVVMVTKAVSEMFDKGGIADQAIRFNGFPSLDKDDVSFNGPVWQIMKRDIMTLPINGLTLRELEQRFATCAYRSFPVVQSSDCPLLFGIIDREAVLAEIREAFNLIQPPYLEALQSSSWLNRIITDRHGLRATLSPNTAVCFESLRDDTNPEATESLDLSRCLDATPLTVSPRQPIEIVMDLFRSMGPRLVLVEDQGELVGMLTIKDLLKEVIRAEMQEKAARTSLNELEDVLEEGRMWLQRLFVRPGDRSRRRRSRGPTDRNQVVFDLDEHENRMQS